MKYNDMSPRKEKTMNQHEHPAVFGITISAIHLNELLVFLEDDQIESALEEDGRRPELAVAVAQLSHQLNQYAENNPEFDELP